MTGTKGWSGALAVAVALAGCSEGTTEVGTGALRATGPGLTPPPAVVAESEPSFDLDDAIERARAAFFFDDGVLVAGGESHRIELVEGEDAFAFTPIHDRGTAEIRGAALGPTTASTGRLEAASPLVVRTESIAHGGRELAGDVRTVRPVAGALVIDRGGAIEELENGRDGLEQRWRFPRAPAGEGDLVVRVAVSGMRHVGRSATGEHFADAATGLGVVYGNATWIDASGERFDLPARFDGSGIVLTVPGDVVDASRFPAVLDPVLGPEISMDAPITGPRGANQFSPAIAGNGSGAYLLVFTDQLFGDDDVRGVRLGTDGTLMDATSFRIATETGSNQNRADVAWNGAGWVVVWQDGRSAVDWDVYGTTVSAAGVVATEDGVAIAATPGVDEQEVAVAAAGSTSLVVFRSGTDASADVLGTRLNPMGMPTDTPFVIGGGAGVQNDASVAATAAEFLVTFTDDPDGAGAASNPNVRGRRVRATGAMLIDAAPFAITTTVGFESEAGSNGTSYLAVWSGVDAGFYAVYASPIPAAGAVTPAPVEITPGAVNRDYFDADVAWNGSTYLVAYTDALYDAGMAAFTDYTVGARLVTSAGAGSGAAFAATSITGDVLQPALSAIGAAFYLVYTDAAGEAADVRGTRITGSTVSTPAGQMLSSGPNDQTLPVVASSGTGYLAVWLDFRSSSTDVWGALLDATGAVSGGPMMLVGGAGTDFATDAAWSGSRYVVVYSTADQNVRGFTVTAAGIATAPFDIAVSTTLVSHQGAVACGPASLQCLVTWTQYDPAVDPIDTTLRGARLDVSGAPALGAAFNVAAAAGNQFDSDVAAAATQFYVVWTDSRLSASTDVRGSRVTSSALDAAGTIIGGAAGDQHDAAVASDGTSFVVAFVDERNGGTRPNDVYSALVTTGGAVMGATAVVSGSPTDDEYAPSIAWNGRRYLVGYALANDTRQGVVARRLSATGVNVDATTPFSITDLGAIADQPFVVAGGADQWLVGYRAFVGGAARTRAILVTDDLTCSGAGDCAAGAFCVDGVCCSTACAGGTSDCMACSIAAGAPADGTCAPIPGCGDAGTPDAGPAADGGASDGGASDGGTTDTDGGTTDTDGGTTDTDGGTTDTDGGLPGTDGGLPGTEGGLPSTDGGGPGADAGVRPDAGGGVTVSASCSCRVPASRRSGPGPLLLLAALGAAIAVRRRR